MTYQFYKTILKFCFPDTNPTMGEEGESGGGRRRQMRRPAAAKDSAKANKDTHFYVKLQKDDVEIMKVTRLKFLSFGVVVGVMALQLGGCRFEQ